MSNLGFQTIYYELNSHPDTSCERAFYEPGTKPVSLETSTHPKNFDLIAFSVSYELDIINIVKFLQASGISPLRKERDAGPLIAAGGAITFFNHEIFSEITDFAVIGEGEEAVHEVCDIISEWKNSRWKGKKESVSAGLSRLKGVYVPDVSGKVETNFIPDINRYETMTRILTPDTEFKNTHLIEISRGCGRKCRFCASGNIYTKFRIRSREKILQMAEYGLKNTDRIGLVGSMASDYPDIAGLCRELLKMGARVSLSSLRADAVTPELLECLSESGQEMVTLAPEAGTERLRNFIGKRMTDKSVLNAIELAKKAGLKRVKLYFMLGLPSEEEKDINGIVTLVKEASRILPVRVSLAPFVPKPNTPFEKEDIQPKAALQTKIKFLKNCLSGIKDVTITAESIRLAHLEHRLARADSSFFINSKVYT